MKDYKPYSHLKDPIAETALSTKVALNYCRKPERTPAPDFAQ